MHYQSPARLRLTPAAEAASTPAAVAKRRTESAAPTFIMLSEAQIDDLEGLQRPSGVLMTGSGRPRPVAAAFRPQSDMLHEIPYMLMGPSFSYEAGCAKLANDRQIASSMASPRRRCRCALSGLAADNMLLAALPDTFAGQAHHGLREWHGRQQCVQNGKRADWQLRYRLFLQAQAARVASPQLNGSGANPCILTKQARGERYMSKVDQK